MIGLLGGTFDPIHLGHLHMAREIFEKRGLKEVWFIPARISPHKQETKPTAAEHRQKMVELAIADTPAFKLLDWELKREGPSYTIDTIRELKKRYPDETFALLIADELVASLPQWRAIHDILSETPLLVGQRLCGSTLKETGDDLIDRAVREGYVEMPVLEVCATVIRERFKKGLNCSHLLPPAVAAYIDQHHLYQKI